MRKRSERKKKERNTVQNVWFHGHGNKLRDLHERLASTQRTCGKNRKTEKHRKLCGERDRWHKISDLS
jgi:hypothetical protein